MYKSDFPIFKARPEITYLDTAASAQKPLAVIEAVNSLYCTTYANIHRGMYSLSMETSELFDSVREKAARFINAYSPQEIVFTKGATEGLNLLAAGLGSLLKEGDEIIISELEHHANMVPWQMVSQKYGLILKHIEIDHNGDLQLDHFRSLITPRTKVVSVSHCSNVMGTVPSVPDLKKILVEQGSDSLLILDACQSAPHFEIDVQALGVDFIAFSGHKIYGPSGTGVLWGKASLLEMLPAYQTGGDMVRSVTLQTAGWQPAPGKFEAGTPNIEGIIGMGAALDYLHKIGMKNVSKHTQVLMKIALDGFRAFPKVRLLNHPNLESGIISFTVSSIHPHDLAELLGQQGVCIRAGQHCTTPLHSKLGISASNRISIGVYTTEEDIKTFFTALRTSITFFETGHV
jgi:cysteine desulfurase/selenocysteine lyase